MKTKTELLLENMALRQDKARLDWIEKKKGDVQHNNGEAVAGHPGMTRPRRPTLREAIDAAMQKEP